VTRLSRWQSVLLGAVVLASTAVAGVGLAAVAAKQGLWSGTVPVSVALAEPHGVLPGTPVRIRGVEAGQVVAVEYPESDEAGAAVVVRMALHKSFAGRVYADGTAGVFNTGLLGSKVIAITPGTPAAGPLANGELKATKSVELADAAAKITAVADEAESLLRDIRAGKGSAGKLLTDDTLYRDLTGLTKDARAAVNTVNGEAAKVDQFVSDGRETLRSVKQSTDALSKMPLVRSYVEDAAAILVRPTYRREIFCFNVVDLFEGDTAILHEAGREHLKNLAEMVKSSSTAKTEMVVVSQHDPADPRQSPGSAMELTRKRAEVTAEVLKAHKAHRISWMSSRTVTTLGLGMNPSPAVPDRPLAPSHVQVVLFTPG
jgi:phospholipid/cholesterol/gamma-HCH transport system substrate-binding protein